MIFILKKGRYIFGEMTRQDNRKEEYVDKP